MTAANDLYFVQQLVGDMQNFAYLIGSRSTRQAFVVDPAWNVKGLLDRAAKDGVEVVGALVTHYHQDHVGGEIFGHRIEGVAKLLELAPDADPRPQARGRGRAPGDGARRPAISWSTRGGDRLDPRPHLRPPAPHPGPHPRQPSASSSPRPTPGGEQAGHLVAGDTLFLDSCGRVDLPGSDPRAMYESLAALRRLPDETTLFPGHLYSPEGHDALGHQKRTNPYLRAASVEHFLELMGY
jgi:glyoxylase-like metal-dependent hydrolase (beta-lactamase superfamily II)